MILILYGLFGFQVIVIQRQSLSVEYKERPIMAPPETVPIAQSGQDTALDWTAYGSEACEKTDDMRCDKALSDWAGLYLLSELMQEAGQ